MLRSKCLQPPLSRLKRRTTCSPTVRQNSSLTISNNITPLPPPTSIYIHLPFCRRRCHYCDFPIIALGSSPPHHDDEDSRVSNYTRLLLREIRATKPYSQIHPPIETIFFGGGTPSLVPPRLVASVIDAIIEQFGEIATGSEVTMEMDPGTFDATKLEEMAEMVGVTRVSLGVQAFQDDLLRSCGRAHGRREVDDAIELVRSFYGGKSWSLDLISSLPRQTEEMWKESLRLAVSAGAHHVSVYDLQVEEGTKFSQLYTPGMFPLPTEDQSANFYKLASDMLKDAGFHHYEISSYCRPGHECRHNLTYWQNQAFYGFGLGAASFINGVRFSRPRRLKHYEEYVKELESDCVVSNGGEGLIVRSMEMTKDIVMLSLRTAKGLDLREIEGHLGGFVVQSLCRAWRPFVESGHVVAMDENRKVFSFREFDLELDSDGQMRRVVFVRLSDPEGFLMSNEVIAVAFAVLSP